MASYGEYGYGMVASVSGTYGMVRFETSSPLYAAWQLCTITTSSHTTLLHLVCHCMHFTVTCCLLGALAVGSLE